MAAIFEQKHKLQDIDLKDSGTDLGSGIIKVPQPQNSVWWPNYKNKFCKSRFFRGIDFQKQIALNISVGRSNNRENKKGAYSPFSIIHKCKNEKSIDKA